MGIATVHRRGDLPDPLNVEADDAWLDQALRTDAWLARRRADAIQAVVYLGKAFLLAVMLAAGWSWGDWFARHFMQ